MHIRLVDFTMKVAYRNYEYTGKLEVEGAVILFDSSVVGFGCITYLIVVLALPKVFICSGQCKLLKIFIYLFPSMMIFHKTFFPALGLG